MSDIAKGVEDVYAAEELRIQARLAAISQRNQPESEQQVQELQKNRERERQRALKRNQDILKDLELTVGRLRTRSLYCPTDEALKSAKVKYLRQLQAIREERLSHD